MAVEAELTAVLHDPARVRAELTHRATPAASVYIDTYYDRPDHGMGTAGHELRVRTIVTEGVTRTVLTYKQPPADASGSKPEHETSVADAEVMHTIFTSLGLVEWIAFEKHCENDRLTEQGRDLMVTIVRIPELHRLAFLEVETMAEPDDLPAALTVLRRLIGELGITEDELTTESYTDRVAASRAG